MLSWLVRLNNNTKLKHKLLISYVLVVMIPVLIIGIGVTYYFRQQAMDQAIEQARNNVDRIKNQASTFLRVPTDISNLLLFNKELETVVNTEYSSILELTKTYHAFDLFNEYLQQYRELSAIRFFTYNPTLVNNLEFIPVTEQIEDTEWFDQAIHARSIGWFYVPTTPDNPADAWHWSEGCIFLNIKVKVC